MAIDLASGSTYITRVDAVMPGRVPLAWQRKYSTALLRFGPSPLGLGWTCPYYAKLTRTAAGFELVDGDGRVDNFADPDGVLYRGQVLRNLGSFQELEWATPYHVVTRWDVETGDIERLVFSYDPGLQVFVLVAIENICGEGLDLLWDGPRLVVVRQRKEARALTFSYDAAGLLREVNLEPPLPGGAPIARYDYDSAGRLVAERDAAGFANHYHYDAASRLTREEAKDGGVFNYKYDQEGRCIRYVGLDGYDGKMIRYAPAAHLTTLEDSYGHISVYEFLPTGQLARQVDAIGSEMRFDYDEHGRMIAKVSPTGATTRYSFDDEGNRIEIRNAVTASYRFIYGPAHLPVLLVDPNGQHWGREYDSYRRLVAVSDPTGATWRIKYDDLGDAVAISDPGGSVIRQRFVNGQVAGATDWMGNWTEYKYDAFGSIVEVVDSERRITSFSYDLLGRLVRMSRPDSSTLAYGYDTAGNITSIADGGQMATFRYGPCGRLLERTDSLGSTLSFEWGTEPGDLRAVTNSVGERYAYERDALGRTIREVGFDGRVNSFGYDGNGFLSRVVNGASEEITIVRDAIGREIKKLLPDGNAVEYEYDAAGNLVRAVSPDSVLSLERDVKGRIVRETQGAYWVETRYDRVGNVVGTTTNRGVAWTQEFDSNHRLTRLQTPAGSEIAFERDSRGRERFRSLPGRAAMALRYDERDRIIEQSVSSNRGTGRDLHRETIVHRAYGYAGELASIDDRRWGSAHFVYDAGQRLVRAERAHGVDEHFAYDGNNNCVSMARDGKLEERLVYGPGDRLRRKGDSVYEFDGQGRLIRRAEEASSAKPQVWTYAWDALDRLRAVRGPDGAEYAFEYDALGRRVARTGPTGRVVTIWNREVPIQEVGASVADTGWIMDPRSFAPLAQVRDGILYPVITDHIGTPREILDGAGQLAWAASLMSWGSAAQIQSFDGTDCPIRFQGQWADESIGLHYNFYRYYDPQRGAYISQDPLGWSGGPNLYQYTKNPINWVDPLGLTCVNDRGRGGKGYVVYHIVEPGPPPRVVYVGITEQLRFQDRVDEHAASGRLSGSRFMAVADHADTYGQARGFEQAHIEWMGTLDTSAAGKDPGQFPSNRCRSYDPARLDDTSDTRAQNFDQHYQDRMSQFRS